MSYRSSPSFGSPPRSLIPGAQRVAPAPPAGFAGLDTPGVAGGADFIILGPAEPRRAASGLYIVVGGAAEAPRPAADIAFGDTRFGFAIGRPGL